MPRSTLSAVRTPSSESPSSTSVIATAGCMPTTTVVASMMREMPEMPASMRPTNASTISSAEMSISTPLAPLVEILLARSSCRASAIWSCMSTWMVTSSVWPICRIGMRYIAAPLDLGTGDDETLLLHRELQGVRKRGLGGDALQVYAQVNDGLGDL